MGIAIIILGIMFLKGYNIGTALAICSIVTGVLVEVSAIGKYIVENYS